MQKIIIRLGLIILCVVDIALLVTWFARENTDQAEPVQVQNLNHDQSQCQSHLKKQTKNRHLATSLLQREERENEPEETRKKIAITFDDGPYPKLTDYLLEELDKRGVKATFFVIGEMAEMCPDTIVRMGKGGHLIGNHTYTHVQLSDVGLEDFEKELVKTNEEIEKLTGSRPLFVRPPYGDWDKSLESQLDMLPVLWDVDPKDWCNEDSYEVYEKVVTNVHENDIILLHDCYKTSVEAAIMIVDQLLQRGYEFVTVDELLLD